MSLALESLSVDADFVEYRAMGFRHAKAYIALDVKKNLVSEILNISHNRNEVTYHRISLLSITFFVVANFTFSSGLSFENTSSYLLQVCSSHTAEFIVISSIHNCADFK